MRTWRWTRCSTSGCTAASGCRFRLAAPPLAWRALPCRRPLAQPRARLCRGPWPRAAFPASACAATAAGSGDLGGLPRQAPGGPLYAARVLHAGLLDQISLVVSMCTASDVRRQDSTLALATLPLTRATAGASGPLLVHRSGSAAGTSPSCSALVHRRRDTHVRVSCTCVYHVSRHRFVAVMQRGQRKMVWQGIEKMPPLLLLKVLPPPPLQSAAAAAIILSVRPSCGTSCRISRPRWQLLRYQPYSRC